MTSPRRAELRRGARAIARRADALRALENPLVVQRDFLQAMQRLPYASDSALAAKLPTWLPLVQRTIKNWVRNTGIVEIAEAVLRDHPGKPSKITTDKLLTAMMLASWKNLTYKRVDLLAALAELPDEILKAYGMFDDNGVALPKSPAFDKQLRRFEKMIRNGKDPVTGAGLDQTDVEDRAVTASLPPRISPTVISLDNTPFESWFLSKIHIKESEARERTEQRYREVCDPDAAEPTPEMGSELMRELARQIGIPIGPDGKAGKLYNPRFGIPKRRRSALFVPDEDIPEGATRCCNGNVVATPEQLTQFEFQKPTFATIAHQQLMGYRNPVEGTNADAKRRHGLRHDTCLAPGLIPHALAAAISAAVRNLQLTLNAEFKRRREHQRRKTTTSARRKNRRRHQAPHDGRPAPTEHTSPQTPEASDQEPDSATSAGSGTLTPPRAPP